jgi:hypothetical protein
MKQALFTIVQNDRLAYSSETKMNGAKNGDYGHDRVIHKLCLEETQGKFHQNWG